MKEVKNTTHGPLKISLPRGKTLHLGPLKTGQIAAAAVEHPPVKKLIEAGSLEIVGDGSQGGDTPGGDANVVHESTHGKGHQVVHHKGER